MTVQELFQSACYKFGVDPTNARFGDDFYSAVNDSQSDISNCRRWGFLRTTSTLTTAASTRTVALPTNFSKFYSGRGNIRNTTSGSSGDKIELMTFADWSNSQWEDGSSEGEPTYCYVQNSNLYLSPIPDAAYTFTIIYYKEPTSIANTSSTITIPSKYSELLKKNVWRRLQDAGYSSTQELTISDADIQRLLGRAAQDDIAEYGGFTMNLNSNSYDRRTV